MRVALDAARARANATRSTLTSVLRDLFGARAPEAIERVAGDADRAATLLRRDPRALVAPPRPMILPGGTHARTRAASAGEAHARALRALHDAVVDAERLVGRASRRASTSLLSRCEAAQRRLRAAAGHAPEDRGAADRPRRDAAGGGSRGDRDRGR